MKKSAEILYSPGSNDECYTPDYAVEPILRYIKPGSVIWCPFDKPGSAFVQTLRRAGYVVLYSHIEYGEDFYTYEPPGRWDVIISNPPFTGKRQIFERALSFGKPFALLMSLTWLNDAAPKQLFRDRDLQLLMFNKRIHFSRGGVVDKKTTFSSAYYCADFLPKQIIMEEL